jgi:hypothetical protein
MMTGAQTMLDALVHLAAVGGPLAGARVHLLKDDYFPVPLVLPADLAAHEADFDGYAPSAALVWTEPYIKAGGYGVAPAESVEFAPTGSAMANLIYGYWLETGTAPANKVVAVKRFVEPYPLSTTFDALVMIPEFEFPQGSL